ncbi:MAG: O-antigen ligase family protein, partial [bacterium]
MNRVLVVGLFFFIAAIPLIPSIDRKVDATLAAATVLLLGLYIQLRKTPGLGRTPLDAPALALLVAAGLATIVSVDPRGSFFPSSLRGEGWLTFAAYIVAALAAARLDRGAVRPLMASALAGGSAIGLITLAQYYGLGVNAWLGIDLPVGHLDRMPGTLGNAFFLGGYTLLVLPVGVASAARSGDPKTWWLSAAASTLVFAALAASQTRIAWAAAVAAGAVLAWVLPRSPHTSRRLVTLAAMFAVTALIMAVTNPHISLGRRAASTFGDQDSSMRQRLYVWKHTLPMIAERPLLGWGFGTLLGRFRDVGSP